jgi:cytoskeletal protein CcmA (bactofilin family)
MAQARSTGRGGARSSSSDTARIGESTRVRGRIAGDGDLTIDGRVEGDIALRGDLVISEGGTVACDSVEADSLTIGGELTGDVKVTGQVRALAGSKVRGNVRGGGIAIDEGAEFAGRIECEFDLPAELESDSRAGSGTRSRSARS